MPLPLSAPMLADPRAAANFRPLLALRSTVLFCTAAELPSSSTPLLMVVLPVYVFALLKLTVPDPCSVTAVVPEMPVASAPLNE